MNINELNEFCIENLELELMHMEEDSIVTVKETIASYKNGLETDDACKDNRESMEETISDLEKFLDYNCTYAIGTGIYGGLWSQGFIIVNKDYNYINFVRTI
jgi:hypothetical protein